LSSNGWKKMKLGELVESVSIRHPFNKEKVIFLNTSDVLEGKVLHNHYSFVKDLPGQAKKSIKKNDILFSEIRPKNKRFAFIDFESDDYVVSTKFMVLRKISENIDIKYLFYYLTSERVLDYFQLLAETRSGTFPQITFNEIKETEVPVPSIEEQKYIVRLLDAITQKIELNNEMNKTLEEMAQAIFKRWFVDFEFPNENGEPYKSSGGKFVESEFGMMPEGWKEGTLDNLVVINTASVDPKENPETLYEHYSIPAFDEQKYPKFEYGREIKSNKYLVRPNSFLVSKLNPTTKRVWDPLCITENAISSTEFINYLPKDISYQSYLYCVLNSERFSEHLIKHATGSTGSRQRVKPADTLTFNVILPDTETLKKFDNLIRPIREKLKINQINSAVLKDVRDTLLPKLMSGEIRVSDAEREVEECLQKSN
jgi:type I restriction enzyme, S subunit